MLDPEVRKSIHHVLPTLRRFVASAPGVVWEKYEGTVPGGGQNHLYIAGQKMKTTAFLKMSDDEQDDLIRKTKEINKIS